MQSAVLGVARGRKGGAVKRFERETIGGPLRGMGDEVVVAGPLELLAEFGP